MGNGEVIAEFDIPEEIARTLSELLIKQTIRERMLLQINMREEPAKFEDIENSLIRIVGEINALKDKITREFVPNQYRSDLYHWNYDGYEIAGSKVQVLG